MLVPVTVATRIPSAAWKDVAVIESSGVFSMRCLMLLTSTESAAHDTMIPQDGGTCADGRVHAVRYSSSCSCASAVASGRSVVPSIETSCALPGATWIVVVTPAKNAVGDDTTSYPAGSSAVAASAS